MQLLDQRICVFVFLIGINVLPSIEVGPLAVCANAYIPSTVLSNFWASTSLMDERDILMVS